MIPDERLQTREQCLDEYNALATTYKSLMGRLYTEQTWNELQRIARLFLKSGGNLRELEDIQPPMEWQNTP